MKLNPLSPTMRERQRYIAFEIISKKQFDIDNIIDKVWETLLDLYGEVGTSRFSLWFPTNLYDKKNKIGLIRCAHEYVEDIRAGLASIRDIGDEPVIIKTLGVTGTIRSAKRKFLGLVDLEDF